MISTTSSPPSWAISRWRRSTLSPVPPVIGTIEKACLYATDLTRQLLTFAKGSNAESAGRIPARGGARGGRVFAARFQPALLFRICPRNWPRSRWTAARFIRSSTISSSTPSQASAKEHGILRGGRTHVERHPRAVPWRPWSRAGTCRLTIRDRGTGIAPEHLSAHFRPVFYDQGSAGSGLGLATAYSIIKKHDGSDPGRERDRRRHGVPHLPAGGGGEPPRAGVGQGGGRDGRPRGASRQRQPRTHPLHGRRDHPPGTRRRDARIPRL